MDLKSIEVKDFLSYKKEKLELPTDDIYLIVGENFTGKSNLIIDALTWGLFGVSRYKGDYIIREGADEAEAKVTFELDNEEHTIVTSKKRGGTVRVQCDTYKGNPTETREYIQELLGLDYSTFSNSACLEQGKIDSFAKLSPKEAKELIINILQLDIYAEYEQVAKQKLSKNKLDLDTYKSKLETLGDDTAQIKELEATIERLKKEKIEKEKPLKELREQLTKQEEVKAKLVKAVKVLEDTVYDMKVAKLAPVKAELDTIKKNSDSISGLPKDCPTCKQKITDAYKTKAIEEYQRQLTDKTTSYNIIVVEVEKLSKLEEEATEKADKESTKSVEISSTIRTIEEAISVIDQDIQFTTGKLQGLEKTKGIIDESKVKIKELSSRTSIYQDLFTAFGRNGIPSFIVENSKLEMETIANNLLRHMEIGLSIELLVQKELQKGGYSDTLELSIEKNGVAKPFKCYSGSERILISFALRIALSVILSRRSGSKMQTLILDESAIFLDQKNTMQFIRGLKYVYKMFSFKKLVIITHDVYLKEFFGNHITIAIRDGVSYVVRSER